MIPRIVITYPDGRSIADNRPGHSVTGLMFYLDPFQRAHSLSLRGMGCFVAHLR